MGFKEKSVTMHARFSSGTNDILLYATAHATELGENRKEIVVRSKVTESKIIDPFVQRLIQTFSIAPKPESSMAVGMRLGYLFGLLSLDFDEPISSTLGEGLRCRLSLYVDNSFLRGARTEALVDTRTQPVTCLLSPDLHQPYGRAIECALSFDEQHLDGISPYAFGLVLERFVARHVSTHSYTTTALESLQRGRITQWQPRPGTRGVA